MTGGAISGGQIGTRPADAPAGVLVAPLGPSGRAGLSAQLGDGTMQVGAPVDPDEDAGGFMTIPADLRRLRDDARGYFNDLLNGTVDTPLQGKARGTAVEELGGLIGGTVAKRGIAVGNLLSGSPTDPSGRSELPAPTSTPPRLLRIEQLNRATDEALLKIVTLTATRQLLSPQALTLSKAALEELNRREVYRQNQINAGLIGANVIGGLITGAGVKPPPVIGGSDFRFEQGTEVLEGAGVLGQIVGTVVFPGWAADP